MLLYIPMIYLNKFQSRLVILSSSRKVVVLTKENRRHKAMLDSVIFKIAAITFTFLTSDRTLLILNSAAGEYAIKMTESPPTNPAQFLEPFSIEKTVYIEDKPIT